MMYDIRFTKIENNHDRLRDDVICGTTANLPKVGASFFFTGEGKELGTRAVWTSPVIEINDKIKGLYILKTESGSKYQVEVLKEHNEIQS